MASGGTRIKCGSFTGTGNEITISKIGFKPRKIKLFNLTTIMTLEWNEAMPDNYGVITTGSTGVITVDSTTGFTVDNDGFTFTTASVNVATNVIYYEVHE